MGRLTRSLLLAALALSSPALAASFSTLPGDSRNVAEFVSDATLEKVVGRTSAIEGTVDLELDSLLATTRARFEVDLTTIDTGISLRNQHMRENHLETGKYPRAVFTLTRFISADHARLAPGETARVLAEGELTLHGVTRTYQVPLALYYDRSSAASVARLDGSRGNILKVSGMFSVKLADHQISRPAFLFLRLAEEIKLAVDFVMTDQLPGKS